MLLLGFAAGQLSWCAESTVFFADSPDRIMSRRHQWFSPVGEVLPLIGFFAAYIAADLLTATAVLVALSLGMLPVTWLVVGHVSGKQLWTAGVVTMFGIVALLLRDADWIKLKPTIVALGLGVFLLLSRRFMRIKKQVPLQALLGKQIALSDRGWSLLTDLWAACLILVGLSNELVRRIYSTDLWVSYKVFGIPLLSTALLVGSLLLVYSRDKRLSASSE